MIKSEEQKMAKQSLPWRVVRSNSLSAFLVLSETDREYKTNQSVQICAVAKKSDAEFIVTACNNFEALLAALEIAKLYISSVSDKSDWEIIQSAIENARKA